jgi:hypothetical protein
VYRDQSRRACPELVEGDGWDSDLSKLAFRLCPSTFTEAKVSHGLKLCHPDWSEPEFPATLRWIRPRVRLSVKKAAWSSPTPPTSTGNSW